jgi:hypothetical protein
VEPTVIASPDALAGAEPITHSTCYILKLHGDYKDARILNTDAELSAYPSEYDKLLDRIFDDYGLIVAGWSGEWDHALRAAILRSPNRRYPFYWAKKDHLGNGAQEIVNHRRARAISITDADSFFSNLWQRVETLQQSQRQNPQSLDLLVAMAKRYLAKPEHRIPLDELLTDQAERLVQKIDKPEMNPQGGWSQDEFRKRVRYCESATEPLARMVGVLGRWGDGSELPLVMDIVRALYSHAEKVQNGRTVWLSLRSYPAVLVFTAYGLGLTRAQRWATLHQFLSAPIASDSGKPQRSVETFFLWDWKGYDSELWKSIEGLEGCRTAFDDHICNILKKFGESFVGLTEGFEVLFERHELLAALVHLEAMTKVELEQKLAFSSGGVRMPVGRIGWDFRCRERLVQELLSDDMRRALLQAGFGQGSDDFIKLFTTNLNRIASKMSW